MFSVETTPLATREMNAVQVRCMTARMLGLLSCYVIKPAPGIEYVDGMEKPVECYEKVLLVHLNSKSALQRMMAGLVIAEWAELDRERSCPEQLKDRLHLCLGERVYFDEIALNFTRLTQETRDFLATLKHYKVPILAENDGVFTLERIQELTNQTTQETLVKFKLKAKVQESLEERRRSIQSTVLQTAQDQSALATSTLAALAGAAVMFRALPEKLTPVARPLMESVKQETDENLQKITAKHLAHLLDQTRHRQPCPNDKILVNLCVYLRCDPEFTPVIHKMAPGNSQQPTKNAATKPGNYNGIVTLNNQQKSAEKAAFKRSNSSGRGPGRPPATDIPLEELFRDEDDRQKVNRVQRRGATLALVEIVRFFGEELAEKLPKLWDLMVGQLEATINADCFEPQGWYERDEESEKLVWALQVRICCFLKNFTVFSLKIVLNWWYLVGFEM